VGRGTTTVIARLWRATIREDRISDYEQFAQDESLPMFQEQVGFLGVLFTRRHDRCAVLTLWSDDRAVRALSDSATYVATVARLEASGILRGDTDVEAWQVHGGFLPAGLVSSQDG
jgi:heme-degrading monooxygenase HmoA